MHTGILRLPQPSLLLSLLLLSLFIFWLSPAQAHSVQHRIQATEAIVLTLTYGNGKPFAHEKYSLYAEQADQALQTGYTDSAGRVFFVPGSMTHGRIKAQASHGHGVVADFSVPSPTLPATTSSTANTSATAQASQAVAVADAPHSATSHPNTASLALFGFSLLLGGFGAYQLFLQRRTRTDSGN